jgi:glucose/arabinose dehydrogenase
VLRSISTGCVVLIVLSVAFAFLLSLPPATASPKVSIYLSGLNNPIALSFAPDGRIFFAERYTGRIRVVQNGALAPDPYYTLPNTEASGRRGLLGLALDPGFPSTPYMYAYQTYNDTVAGRTYNRIVRIQGNGAAATSDSVILQLPNLGNATTHNGGVIAFGPDGKLYAGVGDAEDASRSQDPSSPMGKVLRMNPDGTAPVDNPFVGNASWNPLVYTDGHLNVAGLAFHPVTGRIYETENGPHCADEVNLLIRGRNYGWGPKGAAASCPYPPEINVTNQDGTDPVLPVRWWAPDICPMNAALYGGSSFPAWRGDLFFGTCIKQELHRLHLVAPAYDRVDGDTVLWTAPQVILDVKGGPDGAIWITTPSTIYRYWDAHPNPSFTVNPNPAMVGAAVTFNASASSDPTGHIVSYAWDFGDAKAGSNETASHVYAAAGTFTVTLTVTNNESSVATASRLLSVQSLPPEKRGPQILSSSPGTGPVTLTEGDSQTFVVEVSNPDGNALTYTWRVNGVIVGGNGSRFLFASATPGTFVVNLTASDSPFLVSRQWSVTVVPNPYVKVSGIWILGILAVAYLGVASQVWRIRRKRGPGQLRPPPP